MDICPGVFCTFKYFKEVHVLNDVRYEQTRKDIRAFPKSVIESANAGPGCKLDTKGPYHLNVIIIIVLSCFRFKLTGTKWLKTLHF